MTRVSVLGKRQRGLVKEDRFADFFQHSLDQEKQRVFRRAAQRANQDQRAVFKKATLAARTK